MAREKDAEITLLKQRIKNLTNEKIDIEAEHVVHEVTQQWKKNRQKQSASTIFDSMSDARLHEITQQARETVETKERKRNSVSIVEGNESERQIHELTCKFGMKKTAEQGKNKEVLHEGGESKKRKGSSDVIKGAEEPGQAQESKKRKLLKSGPVFRYLSKEAKKKLTSFWRSAAATDSLWAGSQYETSIYADEVSHILEHETIANSTIDSYAEILLGKSPKATCMILSTRWLYLEAKANETARRKMYDDDLNNVLTFDFVIFPIHEDDHWTLLVLKVLEGTWCFYDSMRVKQNQKPIRCNAATNIVMKLFTLCSSLKIFTLQNTKLRIPFVSMKQQKRVTGYLKERSDCGIIVCKIMKHFVLNEELQSDISDEECNKIRAEILEQFITDEVGSWQSQENEEVEQAEEQDWILLQMKLAHGNLRKTRKWRRGLFGLNVNVNLKYPDFVTDEVGSWQYQENKEVKQAEEEDSEDIHRKSEETSSEMKRKRGQSSSKMKGKSGENAYELRPRANVNRATMEEPGTSVTPTKRRQNQGEVQSKSKHNNEKLDAEGKQVTYRSNLQAMISWSFVQLMEDLPAMSNYNWSQAILDNLRKSVEAYPTKPKNVAGCVMLLLLLDSTLQRTDREVRVFRTLRNEQNTSNMIQGNSKHNERQCDEDHGSTGKDDEDHGISEHDDSPEHDSEIQHESTKKRSEDHGSEENEEQQCDEDHGSTGKDDENHGISEHDDSPEHDNEIQHESTEKRSEDHGSEENEEQRTPIYVPYCGSLALESEDGLEKLDFNQTEEQSEQQSPMYLDSAMTGKSTLNVLSETAAIEHSWSLVLDVRLEFSDVIGAEILRCETPAIEKQSGFYLDSALQKENEAATCKIRELLEQIDEERGLKEEQMEKNEELLKQIEELRALKEDEIKELKSIIEVNNETATSRSRELMEQIDEERGLKEKEMEKNKEQVKQIEELKCEAVKQQEENAAKIAELVVLFDEERGLKEEEMEKNKELVKQMEELKCEAVKKQEENAARIAELENQGAVMNKEKAKLINKIDEVRKKREEEVKNISQKIHSKEFDELSKAYLEMKKIRRDYGAQIVLKDEKIKMLEEEVSKQQMAASVGSELQVAAPVGSELQVAAPVGSELQVAAPVGSELQMAALTPPQNFDCEEECVVDEIAPEKDVQVQKLIKEIKENYPDAEVLENAVHRMNKAFLQSPNSYIKRLKKRTGRKTTQTAEYHYTLLTKQPRKAAELNVQTFQDYEVPIAKQQTTNVEHEEHSNDQENEKNVIDFIPEQYRDMVRIILEDGSSIRVWAAEDLECFVFDDDFRVLVLDEALTTGIMKLKAERTDVLKQGLAGAMECTFIHFPLVFFNHWTLLVLNTLNGRWDFYNSLARLNKKHVEKAKQLVNQIANDINTIMVEGTVQITNKVRVVTHTPQQHPEYVDCGVIVCYLMNRISRNKEIDPNLSREQCTRFRAKMAVKLLTDKPRSWSLEDNEDAVFDI
ncbi:hypothetical protein RHGRI_000538 [Rhododendron griersonianum]|uniref:Ubiquitin-like protease family profile domain-containing protein n=1 Tax=Rhododendron griersonianum TaxID=479676 RepID=A0AAV6LGZ0_9ERIC|nr:hypothetical protein RHGRI_000538 [Rhododendron griersonianum]